MARRTESYSAPSRVSVPEPITVRVGDAVRMTGLSRSRVYLLIAEGELETAKVGRNTLVLVASIKAFIERRRADTAGCR